MNHHRLLVNAASRTTIVKRFEAGVLAEILPRNMEERLARLYGVMMNAAIDADNDFITSLTPGDQDLIVRGREGKALTDVEKERFEELDYEIRDPHRRTERVMRYVQSRQPVSRDSGT